MNDGAIVAVVAITFGMLYAMIRLIVGAVTGRGGKRGETVDASDLHHQRELYDLAMRLQSRVETLERLLDGSQPEWRGKP